VTSNTWFRVVTALLGMSVVDMHRMCRHHQLRVVGKEEIDVNHLRVVHFTDWICGNLRKWNFTQKKTLATLQDSQDGGVHSQRNCGQHIHGACGETAKQRHDCWQSDPNAVLCLSSTHCQRRKTTGAENFFLVQRLSHATVPS